MVAKRGDLFQNLSIWQEESYQSLQGSYPVIALSFADVKENSFTQARRKICRIIKTVYNKFDYLLDSNLFNESEKELSDTVKATLDQINRQNYAAGLMAKGISEKRIRKYGFAFCGKTVLIGNGA